MNSDQLVVAVCGRKGAGKTTLVNELTHALSPSTATGSVSPRRSVSNEVPAQQRSARHRPSQRVTRMARSVWFAFCDRFGSVIRAIRRRPCVTYSSRVLPAPPNASLSCPLWLVLDADGDMGVFATARHHKPDIVLFVTRMDDSRATKADRLAMLNVARVFGDNVWDRTIFVFTHGQSLPPVDLSYLEYVRGRRDSIWRSLTSVVKPVKRVMQDQENVNVTDGIPVVNGDNEEVRFASSALSRGSEAPTDLSRMTRPGSAYYFDLRNLAKLLPFSSSRSSREQSDMGAELTLSELKEKAEQGSLALADEAMYDDPPPPEIAVVELSDMCSRNDRGEKVLPDGIAWMSALLAQMEHIGEKAKQETIPALIGGIYWDPLKRMTLMQRVVLVLRRGESLLALQVLGIVLLMRGVQMWDDYRTERENRKRALRSDLVCELDEEEVKRLTTPDEPSDRPPRHEFDDADAYFFGKEEILDSGWPETPPGPSNSVDNKVPE